MFQFNQIYIILSLMLGLVLQMLPMPDWAQHYRPDWVALILIYWSMALPNRVGMWFAFIVGIIVDVSQAMLLGQHSLALVVIIFINVNLHQRIRVLPLHQQAFYVWILLSISQALIIWVEGTLGRSPTAITFFASPLIGMFIWPWVFIVLRDIRRKGGIK